MRMQDGGKPRKKSRFAVKPAGDGAAAEGGVAASAAVLKAPQTPRSVTQPTGAGVGSGSASQPAGSGAGGAQGGGAGGEGAVVVGEPKAVVEAVVKGAVGEAGPKKDTGKEAADAAAAEARRQALTGPWDIGPRDLLVG